MSSLVLATGAYLLWGCFPLFFTLLADVPAMEILANRVIWSFVATLLLVGMSSRLNGLALTLRRPRVLGWLTLSSLLISANWLLFIWAVNTHRVLESSLGYFITPLVSLLLGYVVLKERMHPLQLMAALIATAAVGFEMFTLGRLPWISLWLALTFGLYGLIRKTQPVDGLNGLFIETLLMFPLALAWLSWQFFNGQPLQFGHDSTISLLLVASGIVTAIPLVMFAAAAQRLNLSVLGFIMYINPAMQFLMAVFVLHESYPPQRLVTFLFIGLAMLFFLAGLWQTRKR